MRGKKIGKMTLVNSPKETFFSLSFSHNKRIFCKRKVELSIGIYIFTENIYHMKLSSLKKMVKTYKIVSQKQNKNKLTSLKNKFECLHLT